MTRSPLDFGTLKEWRRQFQEKMVLYGVQLYEYIQEGRGQSKLFRRQVQLLYPVEINSRIKLSSPSNEIVEPEDTQPAEDPAPEETSSCRPKRSAALRARDCVHAQALSD